MKIYTGGVREFIDEYLKQGGNEYEIEPGVLGYGTTVLHDHKGKLKTYVIKEIPLNEWSSGHTVRAYNVCPKKYMKAINKIDFGDDFEELSGVQQLAKELGRSLLPPRF